MLQILKRKDTDGYQHIIDKLGLSSIDTEISESIEDGAVTGYCIYRLTPVGLFIYDVSANNLTVYDGVVRAVLFLAALKGVEKARFLLENKLNVITLGFITMDSDVLDPISNVLGRCSGCSNK